jgi:hypothetical protein
MKTIDITLLCFFFIEYSVPAQELNIFSSWSDTLVLKTEKVKGNGLFTRGRANQIPRYNGSLLLSGKIPERILSDQNILFSHRF